MAYILKSIVFMVCEHVLMVCIWRHGGHVGGTTQRNMLLISLSDPAGMGGWHCPPHRKRMIANQEYMNMDPLNNRICYATACWGWYVSNFVSTKHAYIDASAKWYTVNNVGKSAREILFDVRKKVAYLKYGGGLLHKKLSSIKWQEFC